MGIYVDAEIRYGLVIPEDTDHEEVEALVEDEDGLEVANFGDFEWYEGDCPQYALVTTEPKVRCGELAVERFDIRPLSDRHGILPAYEEVAKQAAASLWGGDWVADAGWLLIWSRG